MSFSTSPNTRLIVVTPARAGGFDVHFVFQNGASQRSEYLGTVAATEVVPQLVEAAHVAADDTWTVILDGRGSTWIAPHYRSLDDRRVAAG